MPRATQEWVGKSDSTPAPARVRLRVWERDKGICQCGCGTIIRPGMAWQTDHTIALINGGENRESNLRTLLVSCHSKKTAEDVHEKSVIAKKRKSFLGLKQSKYIMPGSKRSKWRRKMDGTVVRR